MKPKIVLAVLLLFLAGVPFLLAQPGDFSEKKDKVEALKIAFITRKLNLKPDEAKVFWPVYNLYRDELETLRKNQKKERLSAREDFLNMTDKEVERLVDNEIIFRQNEIDIMKKYHVQFKKILPVKKLALLYNSEEEFKRELLKKIQEKSSGIPK